MTTDTLAAALEREHREIDAGVHAFLAALDHDTLDREPLRRAMDALRRHIFLEEEYLFPPLRDAGLFAPVFVMLRQHGEIWDTLEELEERLDNAAATTADTCHRLLTQLDAHNAKEEPIIYPQADTVLSDAAGAGLHAFIQAGRMPDGWVCDRAGTAGPSA